MPSLRVIQYYKFPVDPDFARHMIDDIGLSDRDRELAWDLRRKCGDTQFYADEADLPIKTYNEATGRIHRRMVEELIRLAQIGYKAVKDSERMKPPE